MKIMLIINLLMFILISIGNYFYMTIGGLLIKSLTSLMFLIMGISNAFYCIKKNKNSKSFSFSMPIALFLAMLGDVLLEIDFIAGATLFALGHVAFIVSYSFIHRYELIDSFVGSLIFTVVGSFILYSSYVQIPDLVMKWICMGYALVIALMVAKAITNFLRKRNLTTIIILIGSILFFISDFMLLLDLYVGIWSWAIDVCLATYYPAEALLAFSILINDNKK